MPTCLLHTSDTPAPPLPAARPRPRPVPPPEKPLAPAPAPAPPVAVLPTGRGTYEDFDARKERWEEDAAERDAVDLVSMRHREGLDVRATTLRMRIEGLATELLELRDEYDALQEHDDACDDARASEHAALCRAAAVFKVAAPSAPRSAALYYDTSRPLRDGHGKLARKVAEQRADRAPDWLPMLTAVVRTASCAWRELSHGNVPRVPGASEGVVGAAIDAVKAVGMEARAVWRPQYNLRQHHDGTIETVKEHVVDVGVPFSYCDRFGAEWRCEVARRCESEDAAAPLTGPRRAGRLAFPVSSLPKLPDAFHDMGFEALLTDFARKRLREAEVGQHLDAHRARLADAVRLEWAKARPNVPLGEAHECAAVEARAKMELAKARLWGFALAEPPPSPWSGAREDTEESESWSESEADSIGEAAPMEEPGVAFDVAMPEPEPAPEPEPEPEPVAALAEDMHDVNVSDAATWLPKPWYAL